MFDFDLKVHICVASGSTRYMSAVSRELQKVSNSIKITEKKISSSELKKKGELLFNMFNISNGIVYNDFM